MTRVFVYPSVRPLTRPDATTGRPEPRRLHREQRELVRESLMRCPDSAPEGQER